MYPLLQFLVDGAVVEEPGEAVSFRQLDQPDLGDLQFGDALLELPDQPEVLRAEQAPFRSARHDGVQLANVFQRLEQVIEDVTRFKGLDRVLHGTVAGQDDELCGRGKFDRAGEQPQPVQSRHLHVGNHDVQLLALKQGRSDEAVFRKSDLMPGSQQLAAHHRPQAFFVVN